MQALERGDFYASTGVELDDVIVTKRGIEIRIHRQGDFRYETRFIGPGGSVLAATVDNPAIYELRGDPAYVRAEVRGSGGAVAWVQPTFTAPR